MFSLQVLGEDKDGDEKHAEDQKDQKDIRKKKSDTRGRSDDKRTFSVVNATIGRTFKKGTSNRMHLTLMHGRQIFT